MVEPICEVLPIAPSTYRAHAATRRDPAKGSARARRDAVLREKIRRVFDDNLQPYTLRRESFERSEKRSNGKVC
jgi:hypothetical protein